MHLLTLSLLLRRYLCLILVLWSEDRPVLLFLRLQILLNILLYVCFVRYFAITWLVLGFLVLRLNGIIYFMWPRLCHSLLIFLIITPHILEERLHDRRLFLGRLQYNIQVFLVFFLRLLFRWASHFLTFDALLLELLKADNIVVAYFNLRNCVVLFLTWR